MGFYVTFEAISTLALFGDFIIQLTGTKTRATHSITLFCFGSMTGKITQQHDKYYRKRSWAGGELIYGTREWTQDMLRKQLQYFSLIHLFVSVNKLQLVQVYRPVDRISGSGSNDTFVEPVWLKERRKKETPVLSSIHIVSITKNCRILSICCVFVLFRHLWIGVLR